ncbi:chaperone protein DNAj [Novymonas esmeraldas]|uniref:Chaperone protein DNAj n=1 Tax=Novymonas esmeraldas TaxID=1808958 RepID=A0AAW0ESZ7_9TRYP
MTAAVSIWGHAEWTPYEVLRVSSSASIGEIRAAFKRMALHTHPDKAHAPSAAAVATPAGAALVNAASASASTAHMSFHVVKEACEVLLDPYLRAAYDAARSHALVREVGAVSDTYDLAEDFVRVTVHGDARQHVHVYQCECRCGGVYEVALFADDSDAEAPAKCAPRMLRCECDSCSLVVEVSV